jgi:predicted membrane-bound spermidine synthase
VTAPRSPGLAAAALLFFLSGFAALVYQVIWQRMLGIFSGVHIYSVTVIVAAFMAGLGFGSLFGGWWTKRLTRRQAVLAFAAAEALIGVFAFASPWIYYDLAVVRLTPLARYPLALPFTHLALLLVPTLLMGASLPLLSKGLVEQTEAAARTVATLYGLNTLGGALGALVSVWCLIGALGFSGTIRLASLLNLAAGAGALLLSRRLHQGDARAASPAPQAEPAPAGAFGLRTWALIYGATGFLALSLELLWFRALDVMIKSSPYTFGHLLGLYLLFLGLGSLAGAALVHRSRRPDLVFLWGQWSIPVWAAAALLVLGALPPDWAPMRLVHRHWSREAGLHVSQVLEALASGWGRGGPPVLRQAISLYLVIPAGLLAVPTFLMGFTFSYLQRAVQTEAREVGWRVGLVQTANIAGSMLGSLLTGTLLLSALGTPRSLSLLLLPASALGALAARRSGRSPAIPIAACLLLAAAFPPPQAFWARFHGAPASDILIDEDPTGVGTLTLQGEGALMRVNGLGHSRIPFGAAHVLMGAIPSLARPEASEAFVIGLGTGGTAWAVGCMPNLRRIQVCEIVEPEQRVLRMLQGRDPVPAVSRLLADPRMSFRFTDGRLALRLERTRYDLIEADALEPHMAFSGNLYSREFFELCRSRLKAGGILCSYAPTARTRRTVAAVFPHVLYFEAPRGPSFVIASDAPVPFDAPAARQRLRSPDVQDYFDRSGMNPGATALIEAYLEQATVTPIGGAGEHADLNTDLFPRDEFSRAMPGAQP